MAPSKKLPYPSVHDSEESYVESILNFVTSCELFQSLCGGVHILDFLTLEPDLYSTILPQEWRAWLAMFDISDILDLLMREDIDSLLSIQKNAHAREDAGRPTSPLSNHTNWRGGCMPPISLLRYIQDIRHHTLERVFYEVHDSLSAHKNRPLSRNIAVGMKPKKAHEVVKFAAFIDSLMLEIAQNTSHHVSHLVDFGSGQNYLGRALASPPYEKQVIAVEGRSLNIKGARSMDVSAKLAEKEKFIINKKEYRLGTTPTGTKNRSLQKPQSQTVQCQSTTSSLQEKVMPVERPAKITKNQEKIQYIEHIIKNGDLTDVISQIRANVAIKDNNTGTCKNQSDETDQTDVQTIKRLDDTLIKSSLVSTSDNNLDLMIISLHSCGNLVHHGLRSLAQNPSIKAVAMVGCCYNLVTERLGPPSYKLTVLRPPNARLIHTSAACDPHGFPMSDRLMKYKYGPDEGIRLNITARMMAVQAPQNWTTATCDDFFTRHFYRALLQRIFLDRGVVNKPTAIGGVVGGSPRGWTGEGRPIILGSLGKACYTSFIAYVRGAITKLLEDGQIGPKIRECMEGLTNEEITAYEGKYKSKKQELSIIWSLMAFSAGLVESVIVIDRWLYLKEQPEVKNCWVQSVFEYEHSPRNLVVVGVK
ncbi:hypothetical protein MMC14_001126 [Varicellaria rhodocarpa]|nr:hypothetical protein [Varicellaria rhodocarpa]